MIDLSTGNNNKMCVGSSHARRSLARRLPGAARTAVSSSLTTAPPPTLCPPAARNWAITEKQEMIDIVETVFRGASKGRGLVVAPKGAPLFATLPSLAAVALADRTGFGTACADTVSSPSPRPAPCRQTTRPATVRPALSRPIRRRPPSRLLTLPPRSPRPPQATKRLLPAGPRPALPNDYPNECPSRPPSRPVRPLCPAQPSPRGGREKHVASAGQHRKNRGGWVGWGWVGWGGVGRPGPWVADLGRVE